MTPEEEEMVTEMESINASANNKLSDLPAAELSRASAFRWQRGSNVRESYPRNPDHGATDACTDDESRSSDTPMRLRKSSRKSCMAILIEAPMH